MEKLNTPPTKAGGVFNFSVSFFRYSRIKEYASYPFQEHARMTFHDLLAKYRAISFSERDKGDRFERLMQAFLQTVPWYEGTFRHVWLWNEFPYRKEFGGKDTGIDLVAQTVEGEFWAIQCKCYDAKARIDKPAVDSFLATSSKQFINDQRQTASFALRLWISTTNTWGSEAENAIRHIEKWRQLFFME